MEGPGDLDCYGRFCVTPEYPNGVYAYFTTITFDGHPAFPYFIDLSFTVRQMRNWDGNGLQKNFTEDAILRSPFIGVDNIVAKRNNQTKD